MPVGTLAMHARDYGRSCLRSLPQTPFVVGFTPFVAAVVIPKLRVPLGFVLTAGVLYFAQPTATSILLGLPIGIAGGIFRALAAGVIKKDAAIATSGVYATTRNPLYFGSSLLACGFAVM